MNMKLIVGLGNPGEKYENNRHNVGFMFVDYLLQKIYDENSIRQLTDKFEYDKYLLSNIYEGKEIVLAKPQTYMNKSGDAVKKLLERFPTPSHQPPTTNHPSTSLRASLIIVHDDLDIPFGKFKIQTQGPKQHNGITDIQNKLRTMDFLRVRIGVDARPPENRMDGEEYVLQNFTEEERSKLPELFKKIKIRFKVFLQSESNCS